MFGMSYTHVTPACIAAIVPVPKSSFEVIPGSRRCTCGSMNPGTIILLVPRSILLSPPETQLPAATMRPSSDIPTSVYLSSPSISALPSNTVSMSVIPIPPRGRPATSPSRPPL